MGNLGGGEILVLLVVGLLVLGPERLHEAAQAPVRELRVRVDQASAMKSRRGLE